MLHGAALPTINQRKNLSMKTLVITAVLAALAMTATAADRGIWHRFAAYDVGQQRAEPCPMIDGKPCPQMGTGDEPCMKAPCPMMDGKPCPMQQGNPCPHSK
jgi:hypothetical protein